MSLQEIKDALAAGNKVHWSHEGYEVRKDSKIPNSWYIICLQNDHVIGLTWQDGVTMNGEESDFFVGKKIES